MCVSDTRIRQRCVTSNIEIQNEMQNDAKSALEWMARILPSKPELPRQNLYPVTPVIPHTVFLVLS